MNKDFLTAYRILDKVLREKGYCNLVLNDYIDEAQNKALVTRIVYGVLEKNVELEYKISHLTKSKPKPKIETIIKIGLYAIFYLKSMPDYAAVNDTVDLCCTPDVNKREAKGFVNALLKSAIDTEFPIPKDRNESLSYKYSYPLWLVKKYIKQYGIEVAERIMGAESEHLEHIRVNTLKISREDIIKSFELLEIEYKDGVYGGFYVRNTKQLRELFDEGLITIQSPSSMIVCNALRATEGSDILDMCAAPGGKAVYIAQLYPHVRISACDIHEHRLKLIESYADRMGTENIECKLMDGSIRNNELTEKYDYVLCDVPCSGLGVAHKKPDILLNLTQTDIDDLSEIQYKILNNAIDYTKKGGVILYSTCTMLREENYNVIGRTLKEREDVRLEKMDIDTPNEGFVQLLPGGGMDGFFIARLRKC